MSNKNKDPAKKSLVGWIFEFAGQKKRQYLTSVFFAILSVACCIAPYLMIARIVRQLMEGVRDWKLFLAESTVVALFWLGNVLFHAISTGLSHIATFNLLGNIPPYRVEEIDINGGACKLDLKVGDHGIDTKIDVETGASDINISVPSGVDCQITLDSAITGKDFKGFEKIERGLWRTPGFGQGTNTITIDLECAVSNISVERY